MNRNSTNYTIKDFYGVCRYYFTLKGCRLGNECMFKHPQIPSIWLLSQQQSIYNRYHHHYNKPLCAYDALTPYFHQFLGFFTYPYYFQLTTISSLEMIGLFANFNHNDWNVILSQNNVLSFDGSIWSFDKIQFTKVCISIFDIITTYKPNQSAAWKQIFCVLFPQNMISIKYLIQSMNLNMNNNKSTKQLFQVYVRNHLKENKISILSLSSSSSSSSYQADQKSFILNPKLFDQLLPYNQLLSFMMTCKDLIKLKPYQYYDRFRKFKNVNDVIIEIIMYYIWQDFMSQLVRDEINHFFKLNKMTKIGFTNDLYHALCQYMIADGEEDEEEDDIIILLKDKSFLSKTIQTAAILDTFNQVKTGRNVWKQYLMNHRCTKIWYKD